MLRAPSRRGAVDVVLQMLDRVPHAVQDRLSRGLEWHHDLGTVRMAGIDPIGSLSPAQKIPPPESRRQDEPAAAFCVKAPYLAGLCQLKPRNRRVDDLLTGHLRKKIVSGTVTQLRRLHASAHERACIEPAVRATCGRGGIA